MQHYYADLHLHSRYSRATSPACDLAHLHAWAQLKGVDVCATGDCTHPAWFAELREKLLPDNHGLHTLKLSSLESGTDIEIPDSCRNPVRFMITGEISSIYKREGKVRKVHSLIWLPSLEAAGQLNKELDKRGNIRSDGRPILGLDPRDLLSMLLEIDPRAALVPAHIWTPWFSMLGAKSGFDSIEECFGDLSPHIFAVETGLSSDAPMNHRIHCLDQVALVSNSDLHSPANLGRNANLFFGVPSYDGIVEGLRTRDPALCGGTIDLFPEEGKYFLNGHRACNVCLSPAESMQLNNICPICAKPLTMGVLHRVVELEQMQSPRREPPPARLPYSYIVPLTELVARQLGVKANSKKVAREYARILEEAGPELPLLLEAPQRTLSGLDQVGAAIMAVRCGRVARQGGYDGVYGSVRAIL